MSNKKRKKAGQTELFPYLKKGLEILGLYEKDKAVLQEKMLENSLYFRQNSGGSSWMWNSLSCKHADAMDSIPQPIVLPRESSDSESAAALSKILPVILGRSGFENCWSKAWYDKLELGSALYGIFWDSSAEHGVGDIRVKQLDPLCLYFEKGCEDLQDSQNVFYVSYLPISRISSQYPEFKEEGKDGSERVKVVDWYYKKMTNGRACLHFCKSANGKLLYASENDPSCTEGYYAHGMYPFVLDTLYPERGSVLGRSFTALMKNCQEQIDLLDSAIAENSRMAAKRRYFAREASGINEEEFADWNSPIVHYSGSGNPTESVMPIEVPALGSVYLEMLEYKVNELKETSGNRDFSQGGTSYGVTAASAIEALQEAGSKLSRDMLRASYRAYEEICHMVIELVRQFYDLPRCFRITEKNGSAYTFCRFDNSAITPQKQSVFGERLPLFDIFVRAQKQSPYAKAAQNELARSFFEKGFFSPERAGEALVALEMMDFEGKEAVAERIGK